MTDTFRKEYKPLSQLQKDHIFMIKTKAEELAAEIHISIEPTEESLKYLSSSMMRLEESVMWAIKAIT